MAATLQSKCSGGIIFVMITKIITKITVPRIFFVIVSARMVNFHLESRFAWFFCGAIQTALRPGNCNFEMSGGLRLPQR